MNNFELIISNHIYNWDCTPKSWIIYVISDNDLLEKKEVYSERELGREEILLVRKYRNLDEEKFKKLKRTKLDCCDHCGNHMLRGCTSCVNKHFCHECEKYIDEYKIAYHQKNIDNSIEKLQPELDAIEEKLKRKNLSAFSPELSALENGVFLKIKDYKLSNRWNQEKTDLWIGLDSVYWATPSDYFYMDENIRDKTGYLPRGFHGTCYGKSMWKLGLQMWGPKDNLMTLFNVVNLKLQTGRN